MCRASVGRRFAKTRPCGPPTAKRGLCRVTQCSIALCVTSRRAWALGLISAYVLTQMPLKAMGLMMSGFELWFLLQFYTSYP